MMATRLVSCIWALVSLMLATVALTLTILIWLVPAFVDKWAMLVIVASAGIVAKQMQIVFGMLDDDLDSGL